MSDDAVRRHEEEWHPYDRGEIDEMVTEHRRIVKEVAPSIEMMVEDFYGELHPTPADPLNRTGGRLDRYDHAVAKIENGGVRVRVPPWMVAIIVASMGMLATIMAAVIVAVFT